MINANEIMHPEDRKAIQMLQSIPYVDSICRKMMNIGYERIFRGENLATMVKCSSNSMPHVYDLMEKVSSRIGISMPEIFVYNDPVMNAFTYGENNTFVCISSSCVERLDDNELMCLMAHECGRILCKHVLYNSVVELISELGERIGIIPYAFSGPFYLALQYWARKSELSADRCAAALMGEETFQRMTLKIASGLNEIGSDSYQLVRQAKEYHEHENKSLWNKIQQNCRIALYSHPEIVNRAYEIYRWKNSSIYRQIQSSKVCV